MRAAAPFALEATGRGRYVLTGAIVLANAAAVLDRGERAFGDVPEATVDLGGVTQVDSGGLAVLLEWLRGSRNQGRRLQFTALPPQLRALARICDAEDLLLGHTGQPA